MSETSTKSKKEAAAKDESKAALAERRKALDSAVAGIEKTFGQGTVWSLDDKVHIPVDVISTGTLSLDLALGAGGVPKGRIIEIFGPESSGKTTLTLQIAANCQRAGGMCVFIDAEHAFHRQYAAQLGVNTSADFFRVVQPSDGEQALNITETLARSGAVDLIIVDSVAALIPKAELEGDMGDSHMGLQARLMSQALRKLTGVCSQTNTTIIFINQIRMKIGVVYGSPETTTGGNALKFYSSVRMDIRRLSTIKKGEEPVGNRTRVKVVKNKVAPPFREAEFDILFKRDAPNQPIGINRAGDILDLAASDKHNIVQRSGAWYSYKGERIGQGRDKTRDFLEEHPELMNEIMQAVLDKELA